MTARRPTVLLASAASILLVASPALAGSSFLGTGLTNVVSEAKNVVGGITTVVFVFYFIKLLMTREPGALAGAITTGLLALAAFNVTTIVGWLGITGAQLP